MDYLTAEVLAAQSPEVRRFLLRTSVLDRMNAALCEAVAEVPRAAELLEQLEREQAFVVSLDTKREWYRYHHLFQSLLQHLLAAADDEHPGACHLAASRWYAAAGAIAEAAHIALVAGDTERVGEFVGAHGRALSLAGGMGRTSSKLRNRPGIESWFEQRWAFNVDSRCKPAGG